MESMGNQNPTIERQPKQNDPQEIQIRQKLEKELLSTPWSKQLFKHFQALQVDFFKSALANLDRPQEVRQEYLQLLKKLAHLGNTQITDGTENLQNLDSAKGIIIITNHLGTAKLTAFSPEELGLNIPIDKIEPFPIRHAALSLIAGQQEKSIYEAAIELPPPLNLIQQETGVVLVAAGGIGRLRQLEHNTKATLSATTQPVIVMYPEGGTSGKRNSGGPYHLDEFQTGALVVAAHLELDILPVCQYFNPNSGFELGILPPIQVTNTNNHDYFYQLAQDVRRSMQNWLNSKQSVAAAGIEPAA